MEFGAWQIARHLPGWLIRFLTPLKIASPNFALSTSISLLFIQIQPSPFIPHSVKRQTDSLPDPVAPIYALDYRLESTLFPLKQGKFR